MGAAMLHLSAAILHHGNSRGLSTGAVVIAALAALLALGCLAWALARRRAFEPRWSLSLRHAMAEAGFRAAATWAEFTDWARLGH
jgi:cytochrome b